MNVRRLATRLATVALLFAAVALAPPAATAAAPGGPGPALTVPEDQLAAAVRCDPDVQPGSGRQAVLLVHGTGSTPEEAWGWGYQRALPSDGFGVCTVTLPDRAVGNFTVSAEYAVYAARYAFRQSGRKIAMVGHSQGGTMAAWIATFWPDVARNATDVISLAGPMQGTALANSLCAGGSCSALAWQLRIGSHTTTALTSAPRPRTAAFTSIGTRQDEVVFPQPFANRLPGAANVQVQDVCPLRTVDHGLMLGDAAPYRIVLDALTHSGPAVASRVSPSACMETTVPNADLVAAAPFLHTGVALEGRTVAPRSQRRLGSARGRKSQGPAAACP